MARAFRFKILATTRLSVFALGISAALFKPLGLHASGKGPGGNEQATATFKRAVVSHYAEVVYASYADALAGAGKLGTVIEAFLSKPSEPALKHARIAWLDARKPYLQTEAYRFYDGPIDEVEGYINAWPIDENLIDYVAEDAKAGIINDPVKYPLITPELLVQLNEKQGERSITTGFHAIEFLLWGQDQSTNGPGNRSASDYATADHAERRRTYLRAATQLLLRDLQQVTLAWTPGQSTNYRARFLALEPDHALALLLKGLGSLSGPELSGERLTVAYQTKEQEDEHSCFSDTTHLDLQYDALGIDNVYFGRYVRTDGSKLEGPSLHELLRKEHPALAIQLAKELEASGRAARAIPTPFDQAVLGDDSSPGRQAVRHAIQAFQTQADTFAKAAAALKLRLNL